MSFKESPKLTLPGSARESRPESSAQSEGLTVGPLGREDQAEVLAFLGQRPIHTVIMAGLILDNGMVSPLNRGNFFGCRDQAGELQGVALIGHITMIETSAEAALKLFAGLAQGFPRANVIIGESARVGRFWKFWALSGQPMRLACRELLFEQSWPVDVNEPVSLRKATLCDIGQIMPIHAQMAFEESAVNPLEKDPIGFRERVAQRIQLGRVWTCSEQGQLICKADVVSVTPAQVYLEGVYVSPSYRGQGYGARFVSQLSRTLLATAKSISVLVNEKNRAAQSFYQKIGYQFRGYYDTIYLEQKKRNNCSDVIQSHAVSTQELCAGLIRA